MFTLNIEDPGRKNRRVIKSTLELINDLKQKNHHAIKIIH